MNEARLNALMQNIRLFIADMEHAAFNLGFDAGVTTEAGRLRELAAARARVAAPLAAPAWPVGKRTAPVPPPPQADRMAGRKWCGHRVGESCRCTRGPEYSQ